MSSDRGELSLSNYINALSTFAGYISPTGRVELVNKTAAEAAGLPMDSFIGKAFKDCHWWNFSRESQDRLTQDIKSCAQGEKIDREVKIQVIDGQFINIRFILTPLTDATGKVIYLVAEGQDTTLHHQNLRNLSDYINALATFTAQLTPTGHVELVNKAAAESTGLAVDSFIGKTFKDCHWWNFSRESQDQLAQDIKECASGNKIDREVEIQVADGQFMTIRFILTPITNAAGKITYLVAEGQDITERHQDLSNLKDYVNALTTFTAQLTPTGYIELLNEVGAKITGLPVESFIGKELKGCYWWNYSLESQDRLAHDIKECALGKRIDREAEIQVADGQFMTIRFMLTPITGATGSVIYLVAEGHDIAERKQLERTLRHEKEVAEQLASHDSLTGLPNRRRFMEYAEDRISLARRRKEPLALLYIDLDGFKRINDEIGHRAGDIVLTALGEKFTRFVRKGEIIARLGGDEFAMLVYGYTKKEELESIAKRLVQLCVQPIMVDDEEVKIGMSIGISTYPEHAASIDELLSRADEAMYKIKRTTKGWYAFSE